MNVNPQLQQKDIEQLQKDFKRLESKVDAGFKAINEKLDLMQLFMPRTEIDERLDKKADKDDVDEIKDNLKWLVRLVIGLVVTALIGLVVVNK